MNQTTQWVQKSLENHLFFARIMKEHSFFLKVGFLPPNGNLAEEAEHFLREFECLLSRALSLSARVVSRAVTQSGELVTEFTLLAESQSQRLTGTCLDSTLTRRAMELEGDGLWIPPELAGQVRRLNRDSLPLLDGLIRFKTRLLTSVNSCRIATGNYPLLIEHILREAKLYRSHILLLEEKQDSRESMNEELFWNQIMMEHALFIRGLLDPSEDTLIQTANDFANDYRRLLAQSAKANDQMMASALPLTEKFRDFKKAGVTGIENCKIRSLILPLLADHVLREANHYLRLLAGNEY